VRQPFFSIGGVFSNVASLAEARPPHYFVGVARKQRAIVGEDSTTTAQAVVQARACRVKILINGIDRGRHLVISSGMLDG